MTRPSQHRLAVVASLLATLTGVYLLFAPHWLGYGRPAATVERFLGPVIASFALMSCWETTRGCRFVNLLAAAALAGLALSPWPGPYPMRAVISDCAVAAVVVALTLVPSPPTADYGGGWSRLFKTP